MHFDPIIQSLKERREFLQLTQEELATLAGIGLRTLKQLESGTGNPTLDTLRKVSDVMGFDVKIQVKQV